VTAPHAVVVGGTGMLSGVSLALAPGGTATVVARGARGLARLSDERRRAGGTLHPVALDYRDGDALVAALRHAIGRFGPVGVAVAWVHSTAPGAAEAVARAVADPAAPCRFVHVLGSATADPSRPDDGRRARFAAIPGLEYREAVLGFVVEGGASRWLSDDEISSGVLRAVEGSAPRTVVGTVAPWSARPS
jgi:hypothetical protein